MSGNPSSDYLIYNTIYKIKQHWNELRGHIHLNSAADAENRWLMQVPFFRQLSLHNSIGIVLWNIVTNRFLFVVDERNIIQYDPSNYTGENGVEFSLANFHPDHLHAVQLLNQRMGKYFAGNKHIPCDKMISSFDALYRIKDGSYMHLLQQIVPVEADENGTPFLFLSYIRDIMHLKKQPSSSLVFATPDDCKIVNYCFESKELEDVAPFTAQEKRVLQLLSDGKSTLFIAEKLQASPHTVNTHRRHLLSKTNCIDTTALVAYAQLTRLI